MPFKAGAAKQHINRVKYLYNGQQLEIEYNAGEKYAKLEEAVEKEGLDRIGEDANMSVDEIRDAIGVLRDQIARNGTSPAELRAELAELLNDIGDTPDGPSIAEIRRKLADSVCIVIEKWDFEDETGKPLPIEGKALAAVGLPLEFYTGLATKINEDFSSRAGGTKRRS